MTDDIRSAIDEIRAEERLIIETKRYLYEEIRRREKGIRRVSHKRIMAAAASVLLVLISGIFTYSTYFTAFAYVDLDINPSIELELNRYDRIIGAFAYNDGGEEMIDNLSIKHKSYIEALAVLMREMAERGYIQDNALISVTLQTDDESKESILLDSIRSGVEAYISNMSGTTQIDVFSVSSDTRENSHEHNISPAKYLAIQELIEVDPTATLESCRGHSISEIRELTESHGKHHGTGVVTEDQEDGDEVESNDELKESTDSTAENPKNSGQNSGKGHGGKHHGSGH